MKEMIKLFKLIKEIEKIKNKSYFNNAINIK